MQWLSWWNKANVTAGFSGSFSSKEAAEHDSLETDKVEPVSSCCCGPAKSQVDDSCWGWVKQSWEQQYCSALRCSKQMTQSLTHYHTRDCRQRRSNQSMRPFFWKLNIGRDILKCLVAISRWLYDGFMMTQCWWTWGEGVGDSPTAHENAQLWTGCMISLSMFARKIMVKDKEGQCRPLYCL